jgi:hypothetical protein
MSEPYREGLCWRVGDGESIQDACKIQHQTILPTRSGEHGHTVSDQRPGVRNLPNGRLNRQCTGVEREMKVWGLEVGRDQGEEASSVQYKQRELPHHTGTMDRRGSKRQEVFVDHVHKMLIHAHKRIDGPFFSNWSSP